MRDVAVVSVAQSTHRRRVDDLNEVEMIQPVIHAALDGIGAKIADIGFGEKAPPTPFVSALVLLDGAAVSTYGTLLEVPIEDVRIGMRVEPVWVPDEELTYSAENVTHWRPIDEPDVAPETLKGHF